MQVLFGIDLTVREGEMVALLGHQRGRQVKPAEVHHRTAPGPRGGASPSTAHDITSRGYRAHRRPGTNHDAGRSRRVRVADRHGEPASGVMAPPRRSSGSRASPAPRPWSASPSCGSVPTRRPATCRAGSSRCCRWPWRSWSGPVSCASTSCRSGLAPTVVAPLIEAVKEIHRQGTTVIIVEQSVQVALLVAQEATFLEKGQVRFSGPSADLLDRPDLLRAVFIGGGYPSVPGARHQRCHTDTGEADRAC